MRITKPQYETAKRQVAKLKAAEKTVKTWEDAIESIQDNMAGMEVLEVLIDKNGKVSVRSVKAEEDTHAPAGTGAA